MKHTLVSRQAVPGAQRTPAGYVLTWDDVALMGILNVTPDSFSDGGQHATPSAALAHAQAMLRAGARVIDVGGESTRPGAESVSTALELDRVLPVVERLARETHAVIAVDTRKPEVAAAALAAGAHLINDVGGLRDPAMLELCARAGVPVVVMHMQGEPRTMQQAPHYEDVVAEVHGFLKGTAERALAAGVPSVMLDPGIGFGKRLAHNLPLIRALPELVSLRYPVLLGASRKGFIHALADVPNPTARDPGTLALHLRGVMAGVAMVRVHNVAAHAQAFRVWVALEESCG